ncbi:MAG: peptidyl-prolyl cis-trans isomerase A (cyclophilin A) [Candidatus Latescibacterota bacterium]|jgi:peptidyl-prolyl cis-trans isomerase A (cyclophilin A)
MLRFVVLSWTLLLAAGCGSDDGMGKLNKEALMEPTSEVMKEEGPAEYTVIFETTAGEFELTVNRDWAPRGADRFYNLVKNGYYNEQRFFRVVPGFVVQWGMSGDPELTKQWQGAQILDDPVKESNTRGRITFAATNSPNSRTSQVFINLGDNTNLDGMRFAPFGEVTKGMEVVDQITAEYGQQPDQGSIGTRGNEYLEESFPNLDYIKSVRID